MGFNCGIVGLPNVGKSTLFNALTATQAAQAANFPFCTIEPNIGRVAVPDPRLDTLVKLANSQKTVPTQLEFVDIAGLVRGAAKGEGLGNQFLANIREVDAILYVLRCFEDSNITHVEGSVDPIRDAETVETELLLADLDSLERRQNSLAKKAKGGDREAKDLLEIVDKALVLAAEGKPLRTLKLTALEKPLFDSLQLLTGKPVMYICNVDEASAADGNAFSRLVDARAKAEGTVAVRLCASMEAEVAMLENPADRVEFLEAASLSEAGLDKVIRAGYEMLGLITFFTVGPKEARAWTIIKGSKAPNAAGAIHSDFERGFIRAETTAFADYVAHNGEVGAKEAGKTRSEGKEYVVMDGDIMLFRFNV